MGGYYKRGTSNSNVRGSAADRRRRKQWLLDNYGDGTTVLCSFGCGELLTFDTLTVDRFPVPGCDGGHYTRDNIRPACGPCNFGEGASMGGQRAAAAKLASESKV